MTRRRIRQPPQPPPPPATPLPELQEHVARILNGPDSIAVRREAVKLMRQISAEKVYPPNEYLDRTELFFRLNQFVHPDEQTDIW